MTLISALAAVVKDSEIKEINFTSPISLGGKRAAEGAAAQADPKKPKGSGKDKGKGKGKDGKGKGKGKDGKGTGRPAGKGRRKWKSMTADGRQICYKNDSAAGCTDTACARVHCCRVCEGDHKTADCPP